MIFDGKCASFGEFRRNKTRAAAAKSLQQAQECVARIIKGANFFCARKLRVARSFGTEIVRFCGRKSRDFACKILKIGTIAGERFIYYKS